MPTSRALRSAFSCFLGVALFALTGCQSNRLVLVTVDSTNPLTVDHLDVQATIGSDVRAFSIALEDKSIPPQHTFAVQVASSFSGTMSVLIQAVDADGTPIAQAEGSVSLAGGGKIPLAITFGDVVTGDDGGTDDLGTDDAGNDLSMPPCTPVAVACAGSTLVTTCSDGTSSSVGCALGCGGSPAAHCKLVYPTAPVAQSDLYATDLAATATTLPAGVTVIFDAEVGTITVSGSATTIRAANQSPVSSRQVVNGIAFSVVSASYPNQGALTNNFAIWSFSGLTIPATTTVWFHAPTGKAIALVSGGDLVVQGTIDARPHDDGGILCPNNTYSYQLAISPGGFSEGKGPGAGHNSGAEITGGNGSGGFIYNYAGSGGGGYGAVGGDGGQSLGDAPANRPRPGGPIYPGPLTVVIGGSGAGTQSDYVHSGAGGGALQLVSGTAVNIAAGAGINLGGCGGEGGTVFSQNYGGAGGGSGGGLLIEAPNLTTVAGSALAANGGGGGANCYQSSTYNGSPGALSATAAPAGNCAGSVGAAGGAGGAGSGAAAQGQPAGSYQYVLNAQTTYNFAAGGGGAVGSIRLSSTTPAVAGVVSPTPASSTLDVH